MKFGVLAAALAAAMVLGAPQAGAQDRGGYYYGPPRQYYGGPPAYDRSRQRPPAVYGSRPQPRYYENRPQPRYQPAPRNYGRPYREPVAPGYQGPRYYNQYGGVWTVPNYGQGGDFGGGSNSQ